MKYFLHSTDAFEDEKISELFMEFGYEGLGLFYTVLEKIAKQEKPIKTMVLKSQLKVGKKLDKCWKFMESLGILSSNNGETFNKQLLNYSESYKIKKEKTAEKVRQWRDKQLLTENVTSYETGCNPSKVKESKVKESKVNKKEKEKSANAPPDELKNDEPKISVSEQKKTEQQKKAIAAAKLSFETSNCQFSNEFKKVWLQLCEMPKWLKKPPSAILASLKNVMDYPEDYAIELCKICIANDNQGLTFSDTKIKYENQQKIKQNGQFNTHKPASIYQPEHVKRANERDAWEAKALQILATKHNQNTDSQLLIE